jgi:hypothetical protein
MLPLSQLHVLAAKRGDGLRPEFLALLDRQACVISGNPKIAGFAITDPKRIGRLDRIPLSLSTVRRPTTFLPFPTIGPLR